MTKDKTVTMSRELLPVPRELLEVIANSSERTLAEINAAIQQARSILAAPSCKVCGDSGWVPEPFSIRGNVLECPECKPATPVVERQPMPSEDELIANGLGYPIGKEDAVKLHFAGIRSGVITILEAWDAIGHDIGCNPSKEELLDSLRNMAAICDAHDNDMPEAPVVERQVIDLDAVDWETIQQAADESNWMPNEYMRNEWVADVCNFLKYGRADTSPPAPVAINVRMAGILQSLRTNANPALFAPGQLAEVDACLDKVKEMNQC